MARPPKPASKAFFALPDAIGIICAHVANGNSLNSLAIERGVPEATIRGWIDADEVRSAKYARAREDRSHKLADEILEIADDSSSDFKEIDGKLVVDGEAIQRSKLRVDARKWLACKLLPRIYGEKTTTEITGANGGPVRHFLDVVNSFPAPKK